MNSETTNNEVCEGKDFQDIRQVRLGRTLSLQRLMKCLKNFICPSENPRSFRDCFEVTAFVLTLLTCFSFTSADGEPLIKFEFGGKPGPYTVEQWKKDWPGCSYEDGLTEGRGELVQHRGMPWLKLQYPAGSYGSNEGGAGWRFDFGRRETVELRYQVCFGEDFDFVKGGKLPGLCGGPEIITGGDKVNGLEGFSARVMWRKDGRGQAYVYHMNQQSKYGDEFDFPESFRFEPGKTNEIRIRVDMNKARKQDGQLQIWVDENLFVEKTNLQWRKESTYGVDSILFNTFHGGGDASWAPSRDVSAKFGGFQLRLLK